MNIEKNLKLLSQKLALPYVKKVYKNLVVSKEMIIIDNYLSGCPDQNYSIHSNDTIEEKKNNLKSFISSVQFANEMRNSQGAKTNRKDVRWKLEIIKDSQLNVLLRRRLRAFYRRVVSSDQGHGVSITDKETFGDKEVILHEYIHILLESNHLRPSSWKWNEGLVTYLTSCALNREENHKNSLNRKLFKSGFYYIYKLYAHKWYGLLKHAKNPKERRRAIGQKVKQVNRMR